MNRIRLPGLNVSDLSRKKQLNDGDDDLRKIVRDIYAHDSFQIVIAGLITLNFIFSVIVAQASPRPGEEPPAFLIIEYAFTLIFFVELLINMYGHLGKGFWSNTWNVFDFIVVFTSMVSMFVSSLPGFTALRLLRAFRVIRLFRRVQGLKVIIRALIESLNAVSGVVIILVLILGIWSILGVSFFGEDFPEEFGSFFKALLTCFQCMTFDDWGDGIARPVINKQGGIAAIYFVSLLFACSIIMNNIVVAVLMDRFIAIQEREANEKTAEILRQQSDAPSDAVVPFVVEDVEDVDGREACVGQQKPDAGGLLPGRAATSKDERSTLITCPLCSWSANIPRAPKLTQDDAPAAPKKDDLGVKVVEIFGPSGDNIFGALSKVDALLRPHRPESKPLLESMRAEVAEEKRLKWTQAGAITGKTWLSTQCYLAYNNTKTQIVLATIIFINFVVSIVEAQMRPSTPSEKHTFDSLELTFNIIFLVELLVNMEAYYFIPFWKNPWNVFDFAVVLISWLSMYDTGLPGFSVLRLFRAFRILRLARRVPLLRQLILGVLAIIPPASSAFVILILVLGIWSILGVGFFAEHFPDEFGDFSRAMLTCLQIMTYDAWASGVARPVIDVYGSGYALYFLSFIFIASILIMNIIVVILLEHYIAATGSHKMKADDIVEVWTKVENKLMSRLGRMEQFLRENNLRYALPEIHQMQRSSAIKAAAKICGPLILDEQGNPSKSTMNWFSQKNKLGAHTGGPSKASRVGKPWKVGTKALENVGGTERGQNDGSAKCDTLAVYGQRPAP